MPDTHLNSPSDNGRPDELFVSIDYSGTQKLLFCWGKSINSKKLFRAVRYIVKATKRDSCKPNFK